jgi:hypothetical protein
MDACTGKAARDQSGSEEGNGAPFGKKYGNCRLPGGGAVESRGKHVTLLLGKEEPTGKKR